MTQALIDFSSDDRTHSDPPLSAIQHDAALIRRGWDERERAKRRASPALADRTDSTDRYAWTMSADPEPLDAAA